MSGPRGAPIVSVHNIWSPSAEMGEQCGEVMIARRHECNRVGIGEPWQIDIGANDAHAGYNLVLNNSGRGQGENTYLVTVFGQRLRESFNMCPDSTDGLGWKLPCHQQNTHSMTVARLRS